MKTSAYTKSLGRFYAVLFILLFCFNTTFAASWNQIAFPKFIWSDPTHFYREQGHYGVQYYEPKVEYYDQLDSIGLNLIHSAIRYPGAYHVLDDAYNRYDIPVILGISLIGQENMKALCYWADGIAYEKRTADWKYADFPLTGGVEETQRIEIDLDYAIRIQDESHPLVIRATPPASDEALFSGTFIEDFYSAGSDFVSKLIDSDYKSGSSTARKIYLWVQARFSGYYSDPDEAKLKIDIWQSAQGNPTNVTGFNYTYSYNYTNIDTGYGNPTQYHWLKLEEDTALRSGSPGGDLELDADNWLNLQFTICRADSDSSVMVYIDSIAVYDDRGMALAYNYWHNDFIPDSIETEINTALYNFYSIDGWNARDVILSWSVDEPREFTVPNTILVDKLINSYVGAGGRRLYTNRPWGHNEWDASWFRIQNQGLRNYGHILSDSMIEVSGDPEYFISQLYPYDSELTVAEALNAFIGYNDSTEIYPNYSYDSHGLMYAQYVYKQTGLKPIIQIQCQEDPYGNNLTHRNPNNRAEILVQGYLALAYGAKGIGYYIYWSEGDVYGIYEWDSNQLKWVPAKCGPNRDGDVKIDVITQLNREIDIIGPCLNHLEVSTISNKVRGGYFFGYQGSYFHPYDDMNYEKIVKVGADPATEIEVVEFDIIDGHSYVTPPGHYFMIVNRDVQNDVDVTIHTNQQAVVFNDNYFLEDMYTHEIYYDDPPGRDSLEVTLDGFDPLKAGHGRLFRLSHQLVYRGDIQLRGTLIVSDGRGLTIEPGTTISIYNDTTSTGDKSGGIILRDSSWIRIEGASGNPVVFQRGYHCIADEDTARDWVGIRFEGMAANPVNLDSSWIRYCNFDNVEVAVRIDSAKSGTALEMTGCHVTDCDTAVYCNNGALDIDGLAISDTMNCAIYAKYSDIDVNKLTVSKNTGVDTGYTIYLYATDMDMDSSQLNIDNSGIYTDGPEGNECSVNIVRSSFSGVDDHYGIRTLSGDLKLGGRYPGLAYTVKDFDKGLYCTSTVCSLEASGDYWCKIVDNATIGAELSSCTGSKITSTLFSANGDTNVLGGGIYMNSASPLFQICYFEENKGPAVIATNGACPVFGLSQDETKGNEFDDNAASSSYNEKAIVREFNRAYSVFDDGANNFYLDDLDYYIYNSYDSSGLERAVTENFWDGEDPEENIDKFYPDELDDWDFTDWSDTQYSIGDAPDGGGEGGEKGSGKGDGIKGGGDGGGENIESNSLLAAIRLENARRYSEAAAAYQAFIDSTSSIREKQVAMRRLLDVSVAGGLNLSNLLAYYQNIKISSRNVQVTHAAANLKCKLFMLLRRYPEAIVEYETVFSGNPSIEDSVFALINIGEAYMLMQERGSASRAGITPTLPQLRPRSWADFEDRKQDLMTLLIARSRGISGGGNGDILGLLPQVFALHQNHPNPFNPVTHIRYDLPELSQVRLEVFNILGRKVCTLVNGLESAGYKNAVWKGVDMNGRTVSSGIYIYRLTAEGQRTGEKFVKSGKMLLLQ